MNSKNLSILVLFLMNFSLFSLEQENISLMVNKLNVSGKFQSGIIGVVSEEGTKFYPFGSQSESGKVLPTKDTLFEIGSVTKIFTNLLLLVAQQEEKLKVDDTLGGYLEGVSADVQAITFKELFLHISGLPRLPKNLGLTSKNPYKDYTADDLMVALKDCKVTNKKHEYSNLGIGVLGHTVAFLYKTDYETILKEKVLYPLDLKNTIITLSEQNKENLVQHYQSSRYGNFTPMPLWDWDVLAPAGALKSSAKDMALFIAHCLELQKSSLTLLVNEQQTLFDVSMSQYKMGYGWLHLNYEGHSLYFHNGSTYQASSFIGFDKDHKVGVIILANTFDPSLSIVTNVGISLLSNKNCHVSSTWKAWWKTLVDRFSFFS